MISTDRSLLSESFTNESKEVSFQVNYQVGTKVQLKRSWDKETYIISGFLVSFKENKFSLRYEMISQKSLQHYYKNEHDDVDTIYTYEDDFRLV
jgi:hypothetical protein